MDKERIYQAEDDQWYFNVRGNQRVGPFGNYHEADNALSNHVSACHRRLSGAGLWPKFLGPAKARRSSATAPRHT